MFNDMDYRRKTILLGVGVVFFLVLGYYLAIGKTISLYNENRRLSQLNSVDEEVILKEIALKTAKKRQIDSLLNEVRSGVNKSEMMSELFVLGERANLQVESAAQEVMKDPALFQIRFEGVYINMVKFIRSVEGSFPSGQIESLDIYKETDRRTKEEFLYLSLIFKNMNREDNED